MVSKALNHLMWLLAQENFIKFSHGESFKRYTLIGNYEM